MTMAFRAGNASRGLRRSPEKPAPRSTSTGQPLKVLISNRNFQKPEFELPLSHHLVITTPAGVYTWSSKGVKQIFKSGSEGLVAANTTNGRILAIADSTLVFLHDVTKGQQQQNYRLKSKQGQVQMLRFDQEADRLYFTTTLQNAVQSFSLQRGELLDPTPAHASPVSVFALSPGFDILLSTSNTPATVLVTHLSTNRLPTHLQPECSATPVVAAVFHPDRGHIFALAFADGTVAVYNVLKILSADSQKDSGRFYGTMNGELGHIRNLHNSTTDISSKMASSPFYHVIDSATGAASMGDIKSGINAISFIPGRRCTTVSVASDGKCCIVNFVKYDASRGMAEISNHWQVNGPATSLCVLRTALAVETSSNVQRDTASWPSQVRDAHDQCIAIGRVDGTLLLYDLEGDLLACRNIGAGAKILSIEWLQEQEEPASDTTPRRTSVHLDEVPRPKSNTAGRKVSFPSDIDDNAVPADATGDGASSSRLKKHQSWPSKSRRSSGQSRLEERSYPQFTKFGSRNVFFPKSDLQGNQEQSTHPTSLQPPDSESTTTTSTAISTSGEQNLIVRRKRAKELSSDSSRGSKGSNARVRPHKRRVSTKSTRARKPPTIPPHPTPKAGGKWARRRAETSSVRKVSPEDINVINVRGKTKTWDQTGRPIELSEEDPFVGPSARTPKGHRRTSTARISPTGYNKSYRLEELPPEDIPMRKESLNQTSPTSTDDYATEWSPAKPSLLNPIPYPIPYPLQIAPKPSLPLPPNQTPLPSRDPSSSYTTARERRTSDNNNDNSNTLSFPFRSHQNACDDFLSTFPLTSHQDTHNALSTFPSQNELSEQRKESKQNISPIKLKPTSAPRPPVLLRSPEKKSLFPIRRATSALSPVKRNPSAAPVKPPRPPKPPKSMRVGTGTASGSPRGWDFAFGPRVGEGERERELELERERELMRPPTRGKKGRLEVEGRKSVDLGEKSWDEGAARVPGESKVSRRSTTVEEGESGGLRMSELDGVLRELAGLEAAFSHEFKMFKEEVVTELREHRRVLESMARR